jgi:fluoride exporter
MNNILLVFLGGGLGSIARYGVSEIVKTHFKTSYPLATFLSNSASCLILALIVGVFSSKMEGYPVLKMLLVVGFCGGFSTFSTFSFETVALMRSGNLIIAFANVLISVSVCLAVIYFVTKQSS